MLGDIIRRSNQLRVCLDKEKQAEQLSTGSCFHSICFFLLDEQQVVHKASCTAVIAAEVNHLTESREAGSQTILGNISCRNLVCLGFLIKCMKGLRLKIITFTLT